MDREVKLSFGQILASPFTAFWGMVTSKNDIEPEVELSIDSTDKTEKELAESSKSIDSKVDAYGNSGKGKSGKAQRRETLESVKVEKKDLVKPQQAKSADKAPKEVDNERSR